MPDRTIEAPTQVLMVRHGQSEWNASGRWQGQADTPLSDAGRRQAAAAADVLGTFDAIWASDLQRARETAEIIADRLGLGPVVVDARLSETDVGPWEGLTHVEIEATWPGYIAESRRPPDAEPLDAVVQRASACLADIAAANPGGEVLVIGHAGVLRTMRAALGEEPERMDNLAGAWFHVHPAGSIVAGATVELIEPVERASTAL